MPARRIERVALTADAPSLDGPFRVSGSFAGQGGAPVSFRATTETQAAGRTPVRLSVDAGKAWPALEFDGAVEGATVAGSATAIGMASGPDGQVPWRASGRLVADSSRAVLNSGDFRFGPEERAVRAEGSATVAFGATPRLKLDLKAKQVNLDAFLRRKGEESAPPERALALAASALAPVVLTSAFDGSRSLAVEARLSATQTILGGDTLPDVSANLSAAPGSPTAVQFDLALPGDTRLKGEGRFEPEPQEKFVGTIDASSGEFGVFRSWAGAGAPAFAAQASALGNALPYRSLRFAGPVEISAAGVSSQNATLALGQSTLTGAVAFTAPIGSDPGRLSVDLASPSLDLATPPDLSASISFVDSLDLSLSLKADALHVADLNSAAVDSGSLDFKLTKTGSEIRIERLNVANLGGASVDAKGASGRDGVSLTGHIRANRIGDFAALVARLAPNPWTRIAAQRADLLSPSTLAFEAHGAAGEQVASFAAKGTLGGTEVALNVEPGPRDSGQAIALALDAPDVGGLLRQLGLSAAKPAGGGRAHAAIDASGDSSDGYDVNVAAILAGVNVMGQGRFAPEAQGDAARLFGSLKISGANVAPLASALGVTATNGAIGPADASAQLTLRGDQWTVSRTRGDGRRTQGEGRVDLSASASGDGRGGRRGS